MLQQKQQGVVFQCFSTNGAFSQASLSLHFPSFQVTPSAPEISSALSSFPLQACQAGMPSPFSAGSHGSCSRQPGAHPAALFGPLCLLTLPASATAAVEITSWSPHIVHLRLPIHTVTQNQFKFTIKMLTCTATPAYATLTD